MKTKIIIPILCIALMCINCKPKLATVSGDYDYETECVSVEKNGFQIVKAWGTGMTEKEAVLNARRRAIDDILFMGIRGGKAGCSVRPIISNPNERSNQERYFMTFFAKGGSFEKYAALPHENWLSKKFKTNKKTNAKLAYEVLVKVDMLGLKNQMKTDKLIQ